LILNCLKCIEPGQRVDFFKKVMIDNPIMIWRRVGVFIPLIFFFSCSSLYDKKTDVVTKPPEEVASVFVKEAEAAFDQNIHADEFLAEGIKEEAPMEMEGASFDIPIVINDRVQYFITFFQTVVRDRFARWLKRSGRYIPLMRDVLKEHGLPEDLVYLAMIESGFNPTARSYRQAVGPWQFIEGTARKYGLRVDWWVDERKDPIKSTIAAARYLKDLYDRFQCWYLAAASYNAGEGAVSRAMRRYQVEDYWQLIEYPGLKQETKEYVPKMIAAALIAKSPEKYGFKDIDYDPPLEWDEVILPPGTSLEAVAMCAQISLEEIKNLNPHLLRQCTPPDLSYPVRIPKGKETTFWECFLALPVPKRQIIFVKAKNNHLKKYRVQKGDTLFKISKRFGVSLQELKAVNRIKDPSNLRIGQELFIPEKERYEAKSVSPTKGRANKRVVHVVREGETLWRIAKSYGVSVEDLKRWNKLEGKTIRPNERLLIYTN